MSTGGMCACGSTGSACTCWACPDLEKSTTVTVIEGVAPVTKMNTEGSEKSVGAEGGHGCKCGSNCTCDPCNC